MQVKCCPNCFDDKFLKRQIDILSSVKGNCSFCKSKNVTLISPQEFTRKFEILFDLYEVNPKGQKLVDLIQVDWNIFSSQLNRTSLTKLFSYISEDKKLSTKKYQSTLLKEKKNIQQWERFREELKHKNRFFPIDSLKKEQLEPFGKYIGVNINKGSQKFYRARINTSDKKYKKNEMGKPPKEKVLNGRANPLGIPYLYLASNIETAISEVRGHKEEKLTIAEFEMKSNLELADLRDPQHNISPFEISEDNEIELIYKNMPFLILLGNELSKPIIPREANLEYLPSQYLSELIKHIGFHGIIYKSSITGGNNYVIFNDSKLRITSLSEYKIISVDVKSVKQS